MSETDNSQLGSNSFSRSAHGKRDMERSRHEGRYIWLSPALFFFCFVLGTYPTLESVVERWIKLDESYSHGLMVLAVCTYLTYEKLREIRPRPGFYWFWLVPFLAAVTAYAIGDMLLIEALQQIALVPILFGGLLVIWGWRQTVPFLVPIGLILFAIPFWDYLAWSLQLITVSVNQYLLAELGINFYVEGVFVYFPGIGAFEIAHGCSGLRYLLVGLTLTFLYGELNFSALKSRVMLVLFGVVLSLAANWIRVFVIIHQGYATHMQSSLVHEHDFFGWWIFAGTLVPVFLFARLLERIERRQGIQQRTWIANPSSQVSRIVLGTIMAATPVVLLATLFLPGLVASQGALDARQEAHNVSFFDASDWMPLFKRELGGWSPLIEHPDKLLEQTFVERNKLQTAAEAAPEYFVGLYSYNYQRPGAEVVQYGNRIYDAEHFLPLQTFTIDDQRDDGSLAGITVKAHNADVPIHLAFAYYVEGRWETNDLKAKLAQLPGILNSRSDASLLIVGARCGSCDGAALLQSLAPAVKQKAERYLDKVYDAD